MLELVGNDHECIVSGVASVEESQSKGTSSHELSKVGSY